MCQPIYRPGDDDACASSSFDREIKFFILLEISITKDSIKGQNTFPKFWANTSKQLKQQFEK